PRREQSGLVEAIKVLQGVEGISFVWFKEEDVVRHPIVARIIKAYEEFESSREEQGLGKEREGKAESKLAKEYTEQAP
ncbi:MAG: PhoH family protein, partial [Aquificaceae bacterium]|nr:PhoH family protein [Aquificaceae bacterium]